MKLYENGKSRANIAQEYDIMPSAFNRWVKIHKETESFAVKDNRAEEENVTARLRKENQRLLMENDILKRADLIIGRK